MGVNRPGSLARYLWNTSGGIRGASGSFTPDLTGSSNPYPNTIQGLDDCKINNNVRLVNGVLCGTAISGGPPYDDNVMFWSGTWGVNQTIVATIARSGDGSASSSQECELLFRANPGPSLVSLYEVMISVHPTNLYADIVRWNGAADQFDILRHHTAGLSASQNGWQFKGDITGTTARMYLDTGSGFSQLGTDLDLTSAPANPYGPTTYTSGLVGVGFWQRGGTSPLLTEFGWSGLTITA